MKLIFAGTTEFGIPTLENLKSSFEIVLVITQPDRPFGRKQVLTPPPIKVWAQKNNIPVVQPEKIAEVKEKIAEVQADVMLVAAYGQIIPKSVLETPKRGSINIHGSILPKYRGASPIQAAILNDEKETGITFIKMDEKMDNGPVIGIVKTEILPKENFVALHKRLSELAAKNASEILTKYISGRREPTPQDHSRATFTKLISKDDARIEWTKPAKEIQQQVLALNPEPGTWSKLDDKTVKIIRAEVLQDNKIELPGKIYRIGNDLLVKCSDYSLKILEVLPEGKTAMPGSDFLNGLKNLDSKIFV